jgi:hypothetical protein
LWPFLPGSPTHFLYCDESDAFTDLKQYIDIEIRTVLEEKIKPTIFTSGSNLDEVKEANEEDDENQNF